MAASIPETDRPRDGEFAAAAWWRDVGDLSARVGPLLDDARALQATVVEARSVGEAVGALDRLERLLDHPRAVVALLARVHPHEGVRRDALAAHQAFAGFLGELLRDPAVCRALEGEVAPDDHALRDLLRAGARGAGADRPEGDRDRLTALEQIIGRVGAIYRRVLTKSVPVLTLDAATSLAGMDPAWCDKNVVSVDGQRAIRLTDGQATELLSRCTCEGTRRRCWERLVERGWPDNRPVLQQLLAAREEMAERLEHPSWAARECARAMAGRVEVARTFLRRVEAAARASMDRETERLLETADGEMAPWNRLFLRHRCAPTAPPSQLASVGVSVTILRELLAGALGWRVEVSTEASVWARGVEVWDVWDRDGVVGRVYLDLFARSGKVVAPCIMRIRTGVAGSVVPEVALLASLDRAASIDHPTVLALCHELGHVVHHLVASRSRWIGLNGIPSSRDVAELASHVFEAWAWEPEVLARFGWQDAEIRHLLELERSTRGTRTMRQLLYANYSLGLHSEPAADSSLELDRFDAEAFARFGDGAQFAERLYAHFPHVIAYGAMYFAYEWARAVARDVLDELQGSPSAPGALQPFISAVLRPGRRGDAAEALDRYLGRPWSVQAYVHWMEAD